MNYTRKLIQQFNLGLDLFKADDNVENKTNLLINKVINDLALSLTADSTVIFHNNDDTASMVCYRLLKVAQNSKNFKLYLYGSRMRTGNMISKEDKFINRWKVKKLLKQNAVLAIPYNPLYKVIGASEKYSKFLSEAKEVVRPIEKFNLIELRTAQLFYHIGYVKKDNMTYERLTTYEWEEYDKMCRLNPKNIISFSEEISSTLYPPQKKVYGAWLTGDLQTDTITINMLEDVDGLIFYFYEGEEPCILKSGFEYWLKSAANTPVNGINVNINIDLYNEICNNVCLVGDFPEEISKKICSGNYQSGIIEVIM